MKTSLFRPTILIIIICTFIHNLNPMEPINKSEDAFKQEILTFCNTMDLSSINTGSELRTTVFTEFNKSLHDQTQFPLIHKLANQLTSVANKKQLIVYVKNIKPVFNSYLNEFIREKWLLLNLQPQELPSNWEAKIKKETTKVIQEILDESLQFLGPNQRIQDIHKKERDAYILNTFHKKPLTPTALLLSDLALFILTSYEVNFEISLTHLSERITIKIHQTFKPQ